MRIYLDTNVIMDFLLDRDSAAYRLLVKAMRCEHDLVISELTVKELSKYHADADIRSFLVFSQASGKLRFVRTEEQDRMAMRRYKTDYADALHYALAVRHAEIFVTKNIRHFPFSDIPVRRPDDLC